MQTTTPATKKPLTPSAPLPLDRTNTYDSATGQVIQKNGQNVAPASSPYSSANLGTPSSRAQDIAGWTALGGQTPSMGTQAKQPVTTPQTNTIPANQSKPAADFNVLDYVDPSKQTQATGLLQGMGLNPNGSAYTPQTSQPNGTTGSNSGYTAPNTQTAAIPQTPQQSQQPSQNQGYITQLADQSAIRNMNLANQARDITQTAGQRISDIGQVGARGAAGYRTTGTSPVGEGNAAVLAQTTAAQQQAVSQGANMELQGVQQGLAAQGQTQSALNQAAGYTQPQMQFGQLTSPQTGNPVSGGAYGSNPQLQAAVSQAVQMVKNGASPNDPSVQALLSTFGMPGQSLFTQAMQQNSGGNYNPTTLATQVSTNQANIAQAQTESVSTGKALQQIDAISPVLTNFLSQSGLNPYQAQLFNGPVTDYVSQIGGSGLAAQWAGQMSDLKNYTSQLLASGYGGTPTGTENATLSQDPSKLSYNNLTAYIQTLKDLGGNRKAVLDSLIGQLGGSQGYTGNQTSLVTSTTPASNVTNPGGNLAGGVGLGVGSWALNSASNLGSEVLGWIARGMF